jgi:hypothetical protein
MIICEKNTDLKRLTGQLKLNLVCAKSCGLTGQYIILSWMGKHESLHDMDPNGMFLDVNVSPRKPKKTPFKPCMGHISRSWELLLCQY